VSPAILVEGKNKRTIYMWNICGVTLSPLAEQVLSLPKGSRTGATICSGRVIVPETKVQKTAML